MLFNYLAISDKPPWIAFVFVFALANPFLNQVVWGQVSNHEETAASTPQQSTRYLSRNEIASVVIQAQDDFMEGRYIDAETKLQELLQHDEFLPPPNVSGRMAVASLVDDGAIPPSS